MADTRGCVDVTTDPVANPHRNPLCLGRGVTQAIDQWIPGTGKNLRSPFNAFLDGSGTTFDKTIRAGVDPVIQKPTIAQHTGALRL